MPIFDLEQAHAALAKIQAVTARAATDADELMHKAESLAPEDPQRRDIERRYKRVVEDWVEAVSALGGEAKGVWLVDFDNGQGFWCWSHPEPTIEYCHTYEEGFAGRRLIAPQVVH